MQFKLSAEQRFQCLVLNTFSGAIGCQVQAFASSRQTYEPWWNHVGNEASKFPKTFFGEANGDSSRAFQTVRRLQRVCHAHCSFDFHACVSKHHGSFGIVGGANHFKKVYFNLPNSISTLMFSVVSSAPTKVFSHSDLLTTKCRANSQQRSQTIQMNLCGFSRRLSTCIRLSMINRSCSSKQVLFRV